MGEYVDLLATQIPKRYLTLEHRHYDAGVPHMREEILVKFGFRTIAVLTAATLSQVLRKAAVYVEAVEREDDEP